MEIVIQTCRTLPSELPPFCCQAVRPAPVETPHCTPTPCDELEALSKPASRSDRHSCPAPVESLAHRVPQSCQWVPPPAKTVALWQRTIPQPSWLNGQRCWQSDGDNLPGRVRSWPCLPPRRQSAPRSDQAGPFPGM